MACVIARALHAYEPRTGRLRSTSLPNSQGPYEVSLYDRAGNQYFRTSVASVPTPYSYAGNSSVPAPLRDESAMYYGADDKLYVADRRSCLYFPDSQTTYACDTTKAPAYERRSAFEEYRYDALGRRVLVRTRSEYACTQYCLNTLRRIVWDGDNVLYEISAPGGSTATAAQMEADTGLAVPFFLNQQHTSVAGFFPYGRVLYDHGGGLDAPLGVVRMEYSDELRYAQVIAPHATWRGSYDRGTPITGQCLVYSSNGKQLAPPPDSTPATGDQYGGVVGGGTYNGTREHCIEVDWPAAYTWSALQYRRGYSGPSSWMGSLIFESRDASGLYYRRNRYYDSEKGRFTQEDPIGLAGGVNIYGFAGGDPTTYADPYGLTIDCKTQEACDLWNDLARRVNRAQHSSNEGIRRAARLLAGIMRDAFYDQQHTYHIYAGDYSALFEEKAGGGQEVPSQEDSDTNRDIEVDTNPQTDHVRISPWINLAHELGGAVGHRYSRMHKEAAPEAENAARTIAGCRMRHEHYDGTALAFLYNPKCFR